MNKKITVKDLQNFKGKKKLVCILVKNEEEALAANKVGFEMLATGLAGKYKNDDGHPNFDQLINLFSLLLSASPYHVVFECLFFHHLILSSIFLDYKKI